MQMPETTTDPLHMSICFCHLCKVVLGSLGFYAETAEPW